MFKGYLNFHYNAASARSFVVEHKVKRKNCRHAWHCYVLSAMVAHLLTVFQFLAVSGTPIDFLTAAASSERPIHYGAYIKIEYLFIQFGNTREMDESDIDLFVVK